MLGSRQCCPRRRSRRHLIAEGGSGEAGGGEPSLRHSRYHLYCRPHRAAKTRYRAARPSARAALVVFPTCSRRRGLCCREIFDAFAARSPSLSQSGAVRRYRPLDASRRGALGPRIAVARTPATTHTSATSHSFASTSTATGGVAFTAAPVVAVWTNVRRLRDAAKARAGDTRRCGVRCSRCQLTDAMRRASMSRKFPRCVPGIHRAAAAGRLAVAGLDPPEELSPCQWLRSPRYARSHLAAMRSSP